MRKVILVDNINKIKEKTWTIIGTSCAVIAIAITIILGVGTMCNLDDEILFLGLLLGISSIIGMIIAEWELQKGAKE